jgi:hypothetical protein
MKLMLTVASLLITGIVTHAQDYKKRPWMPLENRIGIAMGIGSVRYIDENSSPLVYQSRPKTLRLFYNLESNRFLFSVDLDVRMGSNRPKYHKYRTMYFHEEDYKGKIEDKRFPAGGSFLAGRISVGAFYKISSSQQSTFKIAVGARLMNELFYPQGWTPGGLFNALSISPEAWTQHRLDEYHSFTASVRLPVVTRLTRLPYDNTVSRPGENIVGGFFKNSHWVGAKKFFVPAIVLGYNYQINQRWGTGLNYEFNWYNIKQHQSLKVISQTLLANFHHQF